MDTVAETVTVRCVKCNKRLFDYTNRVRQGEAVINIRCRHCHLINATEVSPQTANALK